MSDKSEQGPAQDGTEPAGQPDVSRDNQIAALIEIIGAVTKSLRQLEKRINTLTTPKRGAGSLTAGEPAPWVWVAPPPAAANDAGSDSPRITIENFVHWYNTVFVGVDGSRSRPIPPCWQKHPGLAMEVASLTYTWRTANLAPSANPSDAQYWLHQWRPGFVDRLTRDWLRSDCLDGDHRDGGAPPRISRYETITEHPKE